MSLSPALCCHCDSFIHPEDESQNIENIGFSLASYLLMVTSNSAAFHLFKKKQSEKQQDSLHQVSCFMCEDEETVMMFLVIFFLRISSHFSLNCPSYMKSETNKQNLIKARSIKT